MQRYPTAGRVSAIFALSLATPIIIGQEPMGLNAREGRVPAGSVTLYARDIGQGPPAIVLHGGPDFDTAYLLPNLDRLADIYRLVYYDPGPAAFRTGDFARQPPVAGRPQR